jgi:beta-lactamase class A
MAILRLVAAPLFLLACSSGSPDKLAQTSPAASAAPPITSPAAPASPDDQLAWVVATINQNAPVSDEDIAARFAPSFLAEVPAEQVPALFAQLSQQLAPLEQVGVEGDGGERTARYKSPAGPLQILLKIDGGGKLTTLLVRPDAGAADVPKSWDAATAQLASTGADSQLLVAALDRGKCRRLRAAEPKRPMAIGSTFELYVLYALAQRIATGALDWDSPLAIREEWRSLPSGTMQTLAAGTEKTVRQYAENMISISDNTATDHLLYTIGRNTVEKALPTAGHSSAKRNIPFLGTRELFVLKLGLSENEIAGYLKMKPQGRRRYLEDKVAKKQVTIESAADWSAPRRIRELEWFANAEDLCRTMAGLHKLATKNKKLAPILEILAINPGLTINAKEWPYVGFKGGSEPGVLSLSFLLKHRSGTWYAVVVGVNDTDKAINLPAAMATTQGVIQLLAAEQGARRP